MATKIKLMRLGKMRAPYYRIIVADSRTKREGRVIETIGKYHPKEDPSFIEVDSERAQYWLKVGAQPTEPVAAILKITGDWQKFRGEPAPEPMKVRAARPDKKALFEAAHKQGASDAEATTAKPRKKAAAKAPAADAAADAAATEAATEAPATEAPATEAATEAPAAEAPAETAATEPPASEEPSATADAPAADAGETPQEQ
ncbi:MAG: small subunit ribosomal protein [Frankiales bacterium]|nr:small subunit ribosomal protein [Frankiales bacterium]